MKPHKLTIKLIREAKEARLQKACLEAFGKSLLDHARAISETTAAAKPRNRPDTLR